MPLPQYYDYALIFDDVVRKCPPVTVRAARMTQEGKFSGAAYTFHDHEGRPVALHRYVRSVTATPSEPTREELLTHIAELEATAKTTADIRAGFAEVRQRSLENCLGWARSARLGSRKQAIRDIIGELSAYV